MKRILPFSLLFFAVHCDAFDATLDALAQSEIAQCQALRHKVETEPPCVQNPETCIAHAKQEQQQVATICAKAVSDLLLSTGADPATAATGAAPIAALGGQ